MCVWEEKSPFFPPLVQNDLGTLTGHEKLIDGLSICYIGTIVDRTVPVVSVMTCILKCTGTVPF